MIWQQAQLWLVRGQRGSLKSSTEAEVSVSLEKGIPFAYDVRRVRAAKTCSEVPLVFSTSNGI